MKERGPGEERTSARRAVLDRARRKVERWELERDILARAYNAVMRERNGDDRDYAAEEIARHLRS